MEREIELRYAQKMVVAFRLRKAREQARLELEQLQQDQEDKLTLVIMEAAGHYEQQVRQFADSETVVHQRTTQIEKEIRRLNVEREEAERDAARLMNDMRVAEKAHAERVHRREAEWKLKYETMKAQYETQIAELDEVLFTEQREQEVHLEGIDRVVSHEQEEAIQTVTKEVRESEALWNAAVTQLVEDRAEEMERVTKERVRHHALLAAKRRRELEGQIADCAQKLFRLQSVVQEHDACIHHLERIIAPITPYFDAICAEVPIRDGTLHSAKYVQLRSLLSRFDGTVQSNKVLRGGDGGEDENKNQQSSSSAVAVLADGSTTAAAAEADGGKTPPPRDPAVVAVSSTLPLSHRPPHLSPSKTAQQSPSSRFFDPAPTSGASERLTERLRSVHGGHANNSSVSNSSGVGQPRTPLRSTTPLAVRRTLATTPSSAAKKSTAGRMSTTAARN